MVYEMTCFSPFATRVILAKWGVVAAIRIIFAKRAEVVVALVASFAFSLFVLLARVGVLLA